MAMRWIVFLFMFPVLLASDKVSVKNLELKILNGPKNGAGYASIYNGNAFAVTLYKVEALPVVFDRVELHDHVPRKDENGTEYMEMIEIPEMEIAPGATLFLQRGGKHLMLMGIKSSLCGVKNLTFEFFFRTGKDSFEQKVVVDVLKNKRCE
ncbi:MAG: copper chaperone PCu(A)C [Alphaproteobacteria bacterium]